MTRLWMIALTALVPVLFGPLAAAEPAGRPNIILFLADDLGYGELGCYGNAAAITPNLDRFAAEGLRLTDCHSASSVCSPSRSALLTGRAPYRNGVFTWIPEGSPIHLRSSEHALPKLLRDAGYDTCHVGKWHLNGRFNAPDRNETTDLSAQESERLRVMMARLRTHTKEVEAEGPDWWRTEPLNGRKKNPPASPETKRQDAT